jgi:hypothetical protein
MTPIKKLILCTLGIVFFTEVFAQNKPIDSLKARVTVLENYKTNIEQLYTINAEKLNKHVNDTVDKKVEDIDEAKRILKWLLLIGVPATILGLLTVYFGAVKKARKIIVERIETIVEHKREDLIKLIETQEFDTKLKNTKKLLVLSANDAANEKVKETFSKLRFKTVNFRVVTQYTAFADYDLIIFNDFDGLFSQAVIDDYIANIPDEDVSFVAFTTKNLTRNPRINFSNSPFTLYHSILSTLKYTEILKVI